MIIDHDWRATRDELIERSLRGSSDWRRAASIPKRSLSIAMSSRSDCGALRERWHCGPKGGSRKQQSGLLLYALKGEGGVRSGRITRRKPVGTSARNVAEKQQGVEICGLPGIS
jgi:hypothetical protein